ncbi:MAG: DUF1841 family protein [Burkholderiales bacterium]
MFAPSREQARRFFFDAWDKYRAGKPLEGLEHTALEILLLHPEYHPILEQSQRHIDRDYLPESGQLNPFLHLSLHLAVAEQLQIDQPREIRTLFAALCGRLEAHSALHVLLDCLGETIWEASRSGLAPDEERYLDCVRRSLDSPK